jgi:hypothetical protein
MNGDTIFSQKRQALANSEPRRWGKIEGSDDADAFARKTYWFLIA